MDENENNSNFRITNGVCYVTQMGYKVKRWTYVCMHDLLNCDLVLPRLISKIAFLAKHFSKIIYALIETI